MSDPIKCSRVQQVETVECSRVEQSTATYQWLCHTPGAARYAKSSLCNTYTLHTAHYTLQTAHCTLHNTHCTLHTVHHTLHTKHYKPHTTHYRLHTAAEHLPTMFCPVWRQKADSSPLLQGRCCDTAQSRSAAKPPFSTDLSCQYIKKSLHYLHYAVSIEVTTLPTLHSQHCSHYITYITQSAVAQSSLHYPTLRSQHSRLSHSQTSQ